MASSQPRQQSVTVNGVELCYFEGGRRGPEGSVLLTHATGFHGRCWDQVIAALPEAWRQRHIVAWDQRGHGRSSKVPPYNWGSCGEDLVAFVEALDLNLACAAGHSMGGHLLVLAAAELPRRFQRLVLIDPVIMAPDMPRSAQAASAEDHPVARRRNSWQDWRAMYDRFSDRDPYRLWDPAVLEDYCRFGVVAAGDGAEAPFELACPPLVEASFYSQGPMSSDVHQRIPQIAQPVLVVRARLGDGPRTGMDFSRSPTWPALADAFTQGKDLHLAGLTHFIPMQAPAVTAELIALGAPGPRTQALLADEV